MKTKLKIGDSVKILSGKDKGRIGKIASINRKKIKLLLNLAIWLKKLLKLGHPKKKVK